MVVGPELHQRAGIGYVERAQAIAVAGVPDRSLRIRHQAMDRLFPIDIGVVLDMAADSVADGLRDGADQAGRE